MTRLVWQPPLDKAYETGVDRGVLYPSSGPGVVWNGLTGVDINSVGNDVESLYFDGVKYLDFVANRDFQASVSGFSAPEEFGPCLGEVSVVRGFILTRQPKIPFGMCYRTRVGTGYKLHLVYNATVASNGRQYSTLGQDVSPTEYTWMIDAVPPSSSTYKGSAHFSVNSNKASAANLAVLESVLYGTASADPRLPLPDELIRILSGTYGLLEDPTDPGTYLIQGNTLTEDPADPGTYLITGPGFYEDPSDPGTYLNGVA